MASSAELVRELRDRTGAGVMDCKAALEASKGDLEGAVEHLRKKGLADAAKKQHREAKDGVVHAYIHPGSKIGVLVEVNCETDFVARTDDFQQLVKDLAMQVAAASPLYVSREQVPGSVVEKEREIYTIAYTLSLHDALPILMDCKTALEAAGGDLDKAAELLRKKNIAKEIGRAHV